MGAICVAGVTGAVSALSVEGAPGVTVVSDRSIMDGVVTTGAMGASGVRGASGVTCEAGVPGHAGIVGGTGVINIAFPSGVLGA